ncbi:uncharacterized protein [Littorina saxatilis]|uniref:uncharacterized protein isoform X1 n=1 Tax=Littorina saxatilis TaxID=31220 RepID=UPI0038B41BCF
MVPIRPYTDSDLVDDFEKETQNQKFDGDDEDASREPFILKIVSFNEMKEEEKGEQVGPPNPIWHPRAPHRDKHPSDVASLNRSISHVGSPCDEGDNQRSSKPFVIVPYTEEGDKEKLDGLQASGAKASNHEERNQPVGRIHATPRLETFTMPTILPVEKMEDKDHIEQAPPPYTKLPESTPRRPIWML